MSELSRPYSSSNTQAWPRVRVDAALRGPASRMTVALTRSRLATRRSWASGACQVGLANVSSFASACCARCTARRSRLVLAWSTVRAARSEIFESSNPKSALRMQSSSGSTQCVGSAWAPCIAPKTDPAVAPLRSVSQPPLTARPIVWVKSSAPHRTAAAATAALLMV
jgi:hypothetical protein